MVRLGTEWRNPWSRPPAACWSAGVGERSSHQALSRNRPIVGPSEPPSAARHYRYQSSEWDTTRDRSPPWPVTSMWSLEPAPSVSPQSRHSRRGGTPVRAVSRSGPAEVPDGVETVAGDAADAAFAMKAAAGAAVVYQCLNPPYTRWPEMFPPLQAAVLEGAASAGAKYVAMDNLYAYGPTDGAPLTEDLPYAATGSKGSTRAKMTSDVLQAHRSGKVRVTIGQASDYFGPRGVLTAMGERVFYPALAGKKAQVMGNPDQPHSYTYIPDIAEGLVTLADHDEADGAAWHLPNAPAVTTRQFVDKIYAAAGNQPQVQAMPRVMVNVVGLFNGQVREAQGDALRVRRTLRRGFQPVRIDVRCSRHTARRFDPGNGRLVPRPPEGIDGGEQVVTGSSRSSGPGPRPSRPSARATR